MNAELNGHFISGRPGKVSKSKVIGGLALAFFLGFGGHTLVGTVVAPGAVSLSALESVALELCVFLSGAAVFLSLTAMHLGRSHERMFVDRSRERLERPEEMLQQKTTLQRLESSTATAGAGETRTFAYYDDPARKVGRTAASACLQGDQLASFIGEALRRAIKEEDLVRAQTVRSAVSQAVREEGLIKMASRLARQSPNGAGWQNGNGNGKVATPAACNTACARRPTVGRPSWPSLDKAVAYGLIPMHTKRIRAYKRPARITVDLVGRALFPRLQPYERRRQLKLLSASIVVGILFAGGVVMVMIKHAVLSL